MCQLLRLAALCALAIVAACAAPEEESVTGGTEAVVTDIVPTSDYCNSGLKGGECVSAPPADQSAQDRFNIDGDFDPLEYANALVLPYTDLKVKATGKVYVQAVYGKQTELGMRVNGNLFIYFEDIPFNASDVSPTTEWGLRVYVDGTRFGGTTMCFDSGDRRYDVSFVQHTVSALRPVGTKNTCDVITLGWTTLQTSVPKFAVKGCTPDPTTASVVRCSGELSVPVAHADIAIPPLDGLKKLTPGIGFGVTSARGSGAAPEYLAKLSGLQPFEPIPDRTKFPTLLFGPPNGPQSFPLKIISWNVRRFSSPGLKGPFAEVGSGDIGELLAPYDIVALQEGWDKSAVDVIKKYANNKRATLGLPPFDLHGPIDFDPSLTKAIEQTVGTTALCAWNLIQPGASKEGKCETSGTHGGLWILTALPLAQSGRKVYSYCKGEDCFRAKGVQWVRLYVNPPTPENQACHGEVGDGKVTQSGCDPLWSGDHFIDIFNTHLQASDPQLCDNLDGMSWVEAAISTASVSPSALIGLQILKALVVSDLNCDSKDENIRDDQLTELNSFVSTVAAKDRPAIIVGDFNLDGKTLSGEYSTLVKQLQLGPTSPGVTSDDSATPWPNDYDWDVDHGDIVRTWEGPVIFSVPGGDKNPTGTWIADDGGTIVANKPWAGNFDGSSRYDYILFRPPAPPNSYAFEKTDWIAMKDGDQPVWSSPWPGIPDNFGPPPQRLSDHKPVVATFRFAPLAVPGRFHPSWKHSLLQRVASANATGVEDCWTCKAVDPRVEYSWTKVQNGQTVDSANGTGNECSNDDFVSYPDYSCMSDWMHKDTHDGSPNSLQDFSVQLWDIDTSSGSDLLHDWLGQRFKWSGVFQLLQGSSQGVILSMPVNDNEPIARCDGTEPVYMCLLADPDELGPGQQF